MALAAASPPQLPGPPRRGTPLGRRVAGHLLRLIGWRIAGRLPDEPRFVLIVAPHTSNWDFPVGVFAMFTLGMQATWLGKHTLFRFPVAWLLRWLGGEPIDRSANHGTVGAAIENFRTRSQWIVVISPEGTRKRTARWKTGFHRIAHGAGVPILPVSFDWSIKVITLMELVWTTDDTDGDIAAIRKLFHAGMARQPRNFAER